ncbi:hypothetical protein JCM11491_007056 [Sporobolomyces phaffii]
MPPKATTTAPPIDVDSYLKGASKNAREDEVGDGPEGNWEVAYVYAFIDRFTDLRKVEYGSPIKSVFDLEQALIASSPPSKIQRKAALAAGTNNGTNNGTNDASNGNGQARHHSSASSLSSLSDDEEAAPAAPMPANPTIPVNPPILPTDAPVPPSSDTLVAIIECFKSNLASVAEMNDYHGRKTWLTWLINFVGKRLADKFFGGFRWPSNYLRTRGLKPGQEEEKMFWLLRWEDKIHLFRQMVDYQLTNSPIIREKVQQGYDLGHQRNALRTQNLNPLIVEPLGPTLSKRHVFHIDESARLYSSSSIPAKSTNTVPPANCGWAALTSTTPGYKAFLLSLPEPAPPPGTKKAPAPAGQKRTKGPKPGSKEDPKRAERLMRSKLEQGLEKLAKYDEAVAEIDVKERRVAARRADSDARLARTISRTVNSTSSTRSTRQKPKAVSYANDGLGDDEEIDELEEDDELDEDDATMGRGKRRKTAAAGLANEDDWETSSVASGSTSGRRASARSATRMAPLIPGERRSSRVQSRLKEEGYELGSDEVDELEDDGHDDDERAAADDAKEDEEVVKGDDAKEDEEVAKADDVKEDEAGKSAEENGHDAENAAKPDGEAEAKEASETNGKDKMDVDSAEAFF